MHFFNFFALNLCSPIVFVFGLFFPLEWRLFMAFLAMITIAFPFNFSVFNKLLIFTALGMALGLARTEIEEVYSYKRTAFSAYIQDFRIKENAAYLVLEDLKFDPNFRPKRSVQLKTGKNEEEKNWYKIDEKPILPKTAQVKLKIEDLEKLVAYSQQLNLQNPAKMAESTGPSKMLDLSKIAKSTGSQKVPDSAKMADFNKLSKAPRLKKIPVIYKILPQDSLEKIAAKNPENLANSENAETLPAVKNENLDEINSEIFETKNSAKKLKKNNEKSARMAESTKPSQGTPGPSSMAHPKRSPKPKIELFPEKINLENIKKARFIGRFLTSTPNPMPQISRQKVIMGTIDEIEVTSTENHSFKTFLRQKFNQNLSRNSAQMAKAIILSDTFAVPKKIRATFQDAGIAHLLGVSVLNIAILAMIFYLIFRRLIGLIYPNLALIIPLDIIGKLGALILTMVYCYLVGFEYPLVRSLMMSSFAILAMYFGGKRNLETLLWSAAIILAINPKAINDIGFQLSFGAVLGIGCAKNIYIHNRALRIISKSFFSTFFASLIIIPISIFHFHTTSIQPFLANMIAIPFVSLIITPISLVFMIFSIFGMEKWLGWLLDCGFQIFIKIGELTAPLGMHIHIDPISSYGCIGLVTGVALFAIFERNWIRYFFLAIGIGMFANSIIFRPFKPFILVHPYAIALVLPDKIIAYPKRNYVTEIWSQSYNLPEFDGKNSPFFAKDNNGKIVVYPPGKPSVGILLNEPKKAASLRADRLFVIPYSELSKKTHIIPIK